MEREIQFSESEDYQTLLLSYSLYFHSILFIDYCQQCAILNTRESNPIPRSDFEFSRFPSESSILF